MIFCSHRKTERPDDEFGKDSKKYNGLKSQCKICRSNYVKGYRKSNHQKMKDNSNKWYSANKDKVRELYYKAKYGIDESKYQEICAAQNEKCALCDKSSKNRLFVDHDTGKVRGLLYLKCNSSLGVFGDNLEGFYKVIAYLQRGIQ